MKKHLMAGSLALVLALGACSEVRAELVGLELGAFGSYLDAGDLNDAYGAGAKVKLELATFFAVDVRGSYMTFDDADLDMYPVEAAALLQLPLGDLLKLYGGAGVGYYFFDAERSEVENAFGYFPVAGVELAFGQLKLFGEIRWLMLSPDVEAAGDELEDIIEGEVDAEADGIGVNVGIAIAL